MFTSEGKQRGNRSEGEGRWGSRRNGEREGYGPDVLFERKSYFQLKEEKVQKTNPQNDRKYLYMKDQKIKVYNIFTKTYKSIIKDKYTNFKCRSFYGYLFQHDI